MSRASGKRCGRCSSGPRRKCRNSADTWSTTSTATPTRSRPARDGWRCPRLGLGTPRSDSAFFCSRFVLRRRLVFDAELQRQERRHVVVWRVYLRQEWSPPEVCRSLGINATRGSKRSPPGRNSPRPAATRPIRPMRTGPALERGRRVAGAAVDRGAGRTRSTLDGVIMPTYRASVASVSGLVRQGSRTSILILKNRRTRAKDRNRLDR